MFVLKRTASISLVLSLMLWSCRVSSASRIRRRVAQQEKSANIGQLDNGHDLDNESQRELSSSSPSPSSASPSSSPSPSPSSKISSNITTCASIGVDGFDPCATYCTETTGTSLNTFIELDNNPSGKQYCCACFSGNAYCSDDIPECIEYVNLDVGGLSIKWNQSQEDKESLQSQNISCIDLNVTDTLACIDFCEEETGNYTKYEFRSNNDTDLFFCVCNSTLLGGGTPSYCSDNVPTYWIAALTNSTFLPIERMGQLP